MARVAVVVVTTVVQQVGCGLRVVPWANHQTDPSLPQHPAATQRLRALGAMGLVVVVMAAALLVEVVWRLEMDLCPVQQRSLMQPRPRVTGRSQLASGNVLATHRRCAPLLL